MRRRPVPGLRSRLVLALVLTSVATLLAAGLTVLPPLSHRLVDDRLSDLRGLARTARPVLRAIEPDDLHRDSPALVRLAARLERRTGGRILVYDDNGIALADTAPHAGAPELGALPALRTAADARRDGVTTGRRGSLVFAVTAARAHGDRLTLVLVKRLRDTKAAESVVRDASLPALAVGLAVAIALALLVSRGLLRRLRRLHGDAVALGEEGLRHEVSVDGRDEVGEVARALEAMRTRLVEEEASRQAFVATASHELRTPLASLQATLELLREEVLSGRGDPEQTAARADTALRQTHRLVGLAGDLLDLSRVDGEIPLRLEPLELREQAEVVAREFEERLRAAGRSVEVDGDAALAIADVGAVVRVLRILMDNALHYGAGAVTVRVATADGRAEITVADEGPGLDPDEREAVFVRFARGRGGHEVPGAGLGLAIARGLARAMGGELEALAVARGACFALALPAWHGEPVADATVDQPHQLPTPS